MWRRNKIKFVTKKLPEGTGVKEAQTHMFFEDLERLYGLVDDLNDGTGPGDGVGRHVHEALIYKAYELDAERAREFYNHVEDGPMGYYFYLVDDEGDTK